MGKLEVFEVVFDGGKDVFLAGEWIQGHVRIVLSASKSDIRGIQVKFVGMGETRWTELVDIDSEDNRRKRSVPYWSKELYFKEKIVIFGKDKSGSRFHKERLEAGEHNLPFRFQLPTKPLPNAFEGTYGWIRYNVHAKIDRPWKYNHKTVKLFSIMGTVDLNTIPQAPMPSQSGREKTLGCLCCESGPIKASARIDKNGYVPGETIWVSGQVENNSSREISDLTAQLVQITHFKARQRGRGHEHHRQQSIVLTTLKSQGCGAYGATASMERASIRVPAVPPSQLPGCDIMRIEYSVKFEANASGTLLDSVFDSVFSMKPNLTIMLPVTIGTVPLRSAYQLAASPQGVVTQQPTAPPAELPPPPPPTYAEAVGGPREIPSKDGNDYTFGKLMYAPRYSYYDFSDAGYPGYPPPATDAGKTAYAPPVNDAGKTAYPPPASGAGNNASAPPAPGAGYPAYPPPASGAGNNASAPPASDAGYPAYPPPASGAGNNASARPAPGAGYPAYPPPVQSMYPPPQHEETKDSSTVPPASR